MAGGSRPQRQRAPITVLIADDSRAVVEMLTTYFGRDPRFQIAGIAGDGLEAVQLAVRTRPDILVLDIEMPRATGIHALQALREQGLNIPAVLYSAYADFTAEAFAKALGAIVLSKAETPRRLAERLLDLVDKGPAAQAAT